MTDDASCEIRPYQTVRSSQTPVLCGAVERTFRTSRPGAPAPSRRAATEAQDLACWLRHELRKRQQHKTRAAQEHTRETEWRRQQGGAQDHRQTCDRARESIQKQDLTKPSNRVFHDRLLSRK